jgi:hypothetical protein
MQRYLETLLDHVLAFLQGSLTRSPDEREAVFHEYRRLISRFQRGTMLLDNLSTRASCIPHEFSQPLTALYLLHSQLEFMLRSPRQDLDAKYGFKSQPFNETFDVAAHFTKMLDLAMQLLPLTSTLAPIFTTSIGPLSALWLTAMRAPSHCVALRKRAVELMLSYPRREGFWDGLLAGQIARKMLNIEQESAQEELGLSAVPTRELIVPEDLRVVAVAISYDDEDDRKARIEFSTARNLAMGEAGRGQWLQW